MEALLEKGDSSFLRSCAAVFISDNKSAQAESARLSGKSTSTGYISSILHCYIECVVEMTVKALIDQHGQMQDNNSTFLLLFLQSTGLNWWPLR